MDTLLLLGDKVEKLDKFLAKMGHKAIDAGRGDNLAAIISENTFDLIIINPGVDLDRIELLNFLRDNDMTREVPIIFVYEGLKEQQQISALGYKKIEMLLGPVSVGVLASRIAMQLRLRKFAGRDAYATLGEKNARLTELNERFKKELKEARQIQENLLPKKLPADERFQISIAYNPLEEVGGDWYYVQKEKSGVSLHCADVTGHGLSAAFIGSMTKLALAAADKEMPGELLTEMNRLMASQIPEGKFVTMFSCLYNPDTSELHYARAGHPPALLVRAADKSVEELKGEGFALGFLDDASYTSLSTQLNNGDAIVIFTDGLTEAQNLANEMYESSGRLNNILAESVSNSSAEDILRAVLNDFEDFRQERILKDDITVLVL
ncbi:MAG: hypothetical protein D6719_10035, partial [Candidatus Dadabacteria bacterium]